MSFRFEEFKRQIGFGESDAAILRSLHDLLAPSFAAITERFYAVLTTSLGAKNVFRDEAQVARLKSTLRVWMSEGLLGPYDEAFYERRSRIGRRHVAIGLAQHYMFTAMNIVRTDYMQLVTEKWTGDVSAAELAVNRLLDFELMLMLEHYQADHVEKVVARERLLQTERLSAMQTLSAGLAHEVRNPLNAAALQLELLSRRIARTGDDPKLAEPTKLVHHELQRLSRMLNEFVSFARPAKLELSQHDLIAICEHVIKAEGALAQARGVQINLMRRNATVFAEVDGGKVHQVVQNLTRNAIEASESGQTIELECWLDGDLANIAVRDAGPGISPDVQAHIFEPFYSTKAAGTGLGMAIVSSLLKQHSAEILLESAPGRTEFTVHFWRRAK